MGQCKCELIRRLEEFNLSPNLHYKDGRYDHTLLTAAVESGHEECVEKLLKLNVDVNGKTSDESNALHYISGSYKKWILKKLVAAGIESVKNEKGYTFLHPCVHYLSAKDVDEILNITHPKFDVINECDTEKRTPLHWAAFNYEDERRDVMKVLLDHGANINVQDFGGRTPLIYCAHHGHYDCAELLLERGADKNIKDFRGYDAKHHATHFGHHSIVGLFNGKRTDESTEGIEDQTQLDSSTQVINGTRNMSTQTPPQKIVQAMPVTDNKDTPLPQYKI